VLIHADADSFFASVEARDRPDLQGRPFAVASQVIMCASYAARRLGVRAGLPSGQARRRWPGLVLVPPRDAAYTAASAALFDLFRSLTPLVEPGSMEEAFLDVTSLAPSAADATRLGRDLRATARAEVGLPVSVGVGRTKLLAKVASRRAKPDGLVVIDEKSEAAVRAGLRLDELWGVGPTTQERLLGAGLTSLPAMAAAGQDSLETLLGRMMGRRVFAMATGREDATVKLPKPPRSVSRSRTISPATRRRSRVEAVLADCLVRLADQLAREPRRPTRIEVALRYDDGGETGARAALDDAGPAPGPAPGPAEVAATIAVEAARLLAGTAYEEDGRGVAHLGVTVHLPRAPGEG
jgi:DNA polymerase-4